MQARVAPRGGYTCNADRDARTASTSQGLAARSPHEGQQFPSSLAGQASLPLSS